MSLQAMTSSTAAAAAAAAASRRSAEAAGVAASIKTSAITTGADVGGATGADLYGHKVLDSDNYFSDMFLEKYAQENFMNILGSIFFGKIINCRSATLLERTGRPDEEARGGGVRHYDRNGHAQHQNLQVGHHRDPDVLACCPAVANLSETLFWKFVRDVRSTLSELPF